MLADGRAAEPPGHWQVYEHAHPEAWASATWLSPGRCPRCDAYHWALVALDPEMPDPRLPSAAIHATGDRIY
jgi:hypothetical protein